MAEWPTLAEVRAFLRLQPDNAEDAVIAQALAAAVGYGVARLAGRYDDPSDPGTIPPDGVPDVAHQGALLDASRIYRRRDSIDGTVAWGDMGAVRVGRADPDVERLYAQVAPLVFG